MFGYIRTLWQKGRAARLKEEFLDTARRLLSFTEEDAVHFGMTLDGAFRYWIEHHGAVKECPIRVRRDAAKALRSQAKKLFDRDVGGAYGLAVFSFHVEASLLRGDNASFVYDFTVRAISEAQELSAGLIAPPGAQPFAIDPRSLGPTL
jgi:hypothetical protein